MSPTTNRRILVIDDMPSIHNDFRRILSGSGGTPELDAAEEVLFGRAAGTIGAASFDVDFAAQGQEAWSTCKPHWTPTAATRWPSWICACLPVGTAWRPSSIWKIDPRLQMVICTAHSDYSWDEVLGELGVEDRLLLLKKPFDNIEVADLAIALTTKWEMAGLRLTS